MSGVRSGFGVKNGLGEFVHFLCETVGILPSPWLGRINARLAVIDAHRRTAAQIGASPHRRGRSAK
jgi:hypothetical protein